MSTITITSPTAVERHPSRRDTLTLLGRQIGFDQRAFWRNRSQAFFSIAFPLVFLIVFNAINGSHRIDERGGITYATWFVPGILVYGLIMATFANLATSLTVARDSGVLKRIQGTPLPRWIFMAGRIGSTLIAAVVLTGVTLAFGVFVYGVHIRVETLPGLLVSLVVGSICLTALGLAITTVIPNAEAAAAIVNLIALPITFISGIWFVLDGAPGWLDTIASVFPVRPLVHSLQHAFHPATTGSGLVPGDLAVLGAWTVVGIVVTLRWFRWEPRR